MAKTHSSFLKKALGRIDRLDSESLHTVVGRLAQERNFLETLLNTVHDGVVVVDLDGRIQYYNRTAMALLGLPDDGVVGEAITRFVPALDWPVIAQERGQTPDESRPFEARIAYPEERILEVIAASVEGDQEENSGVMLVFHDVTENRKETFEAIESERVQALTLLAASVAHEIGNPLHALHIHLQLLDRELKKLAEQDCDSKSPRAVSAEMSLEKLSKYVDVSKGEVRRLDHIVRDFLQAIRPVPPRVELEDVNPVIMETVQFLSPELENRGLSVHIDLTEKPAKALVDSDQIKQVLVNLIKNAMQAMTRGGTLTVRTASEDGGVSLEIEDTGVGISPEKLSRIFEPYFTTKEKGSGLGLMIVHRIIDQHGGRIHVRPGKDSGTCFGIWLPREAQGPKLLATGN